MYRYLQTDTLKLKDAEFTSINTMIKSSFWNSVKILQSGYILLRLSRKQVQQAQFSNCWRYEKLTLYLVPPNKKMNFLLNILGNPKAKSEACSQNEASNSIRYEKIKLITYINTWERSLPKEEKNYEKSLLFCEEIRQYNLEVRKKWTLHE